MTIFQASFIAAALLTMAAGNTPGMAASAAVPDLHNPALNKVAFEKAPSSGSVRLIADGKPLVTIVVPKEAADPTWAVKGAADDLAAGFKLVTGWDVPIVREGEPAPGTLILLGAAARSAGAATNDIPAYGFRLITSTNAVAIVGNEEGVGYGVCDFQERVLGIRWYYPGPDGTVALPIEQLTLPACSYSDYPRQRMRCMWPWHAKGIVPNDECIPLERLESPVFRRNLFHYRAASPGPSVACHTFPNFEMHAKAHPECFEMSAAGTRASGGMPCYGNPETLKLHMAAVERFYATGDTTMWLAPPEHKVVYGSPGKNQVSFSPLDAPLGCRCEFCKALIDPKGGPWGEYSRVAATFAAGMAREIKARWPDKILIYLPYQNYTEPPEGIKFPDNVYVQVCLMNGVGMTKEPVIAEKYSRWISGWRRITGRPVQLWEYICWPDNHSLPILCLHTAKVFRQAHVADSMGSFLNGPYAGPQDLPGGTWACGHPMIYGMFRLLWNPDFDVDAMLKEYVQGMYGPAAKPMGEMLNLLQDRWEQTRWSRVPVDTYNGDLKLIHEETAPRKVALKLGKLLAEARRQAGESGIYRRRVDFFGRAVDVFLKESEFYHEGAKKPLPTLKIVKVAAAPVCDGTLDEAAWKTAEIQPFQRAFLSWKAEPDQLTTIRGMWCETGVAFAICAQEPCMDALRLVHDGRNSGPSLPPGRTSDLENLNNEDGAEIFLDFHGQGTNCYQVIANAKAAWWDMLNVRNAEGKMENQRCALKGVSIGATRGTNAWTIEAFIPFAALDEKLASKPGATWKANFIRNRRAADDYSIQRWSTKYKPNNNDTESMGTLRFAE